MDKRKMSEKDAREMYRVGCQDDFYCIADENDFIQNLKDAGYVAFQTWEEAEERYNNFTDCALTPLEKIQNESIIALKEKARIK